VCTVLRPSRTQRAERHSIDSGDRVGLYADLCYNKTVPITCALERVPRVLPLGIYAETIKRKVPV